MNHLDSYYVFHNAREDQKKRFEKIRQKAQEFSELIEECCPDGPEKSEAVKNVRQAMMWANSGISCNE